MCKCTYFKMNSGLVTDARAEPIQGINLPQQVTFAYASK